jgi:hypothetical protein
MPGRTARHDTSRTAGGSGRRLLAGLGAGAALAGMPLVSEMRVRRAAQPLTGAWRTRAVEPRTSMQVGFSFRPLQAEALDLDPPQTLRRLLEHPFEVIRLAAYWNRIEMAPERFDFSDLDWQFEAAQRAGKRIILCVGAVKAFGYPEFFVPRHHLPEPLPERTRIRAPAHGPLLRAAVEYLHRVVDRYRSSPNLMAWQVEHESVDPLGLEHSWRLDRQFVVAEIDAVRCADASRPVVLNGFLPASVPVRLTQWLQSRDQGDSIAAAFDLADVVGVDFYPRHALASLGPLTLYLDGTRTPWHAWPLRRVFAAARARGRPIMITEGQAEPWEAVTTPPNPRARAMYSCRPEDLIDTYSTCLRVATQSGINLQAYLLWGAEYWVARARQGDRSYLQAVARILETT